MTPVRTLQRAVFLDRDGVICENRDDYVKSWDEVVFIPGAIAACAAITTAGYPLFIVTNQSSVGRGIVARRTLDEIHALMLNALEAEGARVEEILVCPHAPSDACACRKPEPGLLLDAAKRHGIDLSGSWLIGDAVTDIQAAAAAGCSSVLVLSGRGAAQSQQLNGVQPAFIAHDVVDASIWVLGAMAAEGAARTVPSSGAEAR